MDRADEIPDLDLDEEGRLVIDEMISCAQARLRDALQTVCVFYRDEDNVFRCDRKPMVCE